MPAADMCFAYASQTGNAQGIAKRIHQEATQEGLASSASRCVCIDDYVTGIAKTKEPVLVIVSSSTGDGEPPDNARKGFRKLKKADAGVLDGVRFAILCLGDQNYTHFCGFPKSLEKAVRDKGAVRFMRRGEADDGTGLEAVVEPWIVELKAALPKWKESTPVVYPSEAAQEKPAGPRVVYIPMDSGNAAEPLKAQPDPAAGAETDAKPAAVHTDAAATSSSPTRCPPVGRHCFYTEVKEGKLDAYRKYHDEIWPEVAAGLRSAGVTRLLIFLVPGTRKLVMTIDTASNIDLGKATGPGSRYRENPKCREWEELMDADFHGGWTECEEIHASDIEWNKSLGLA